MSPCLKVPVVSCCSVLVKSVGKGKGDSTVTSIIDAESSETPPVYITSFAVTVAIIITAHVTAVVMSSFRTVPVSTALYSTTGTTALCPPVIGACNSGFVTCGVVGESDNATSDDTCGSDETT